MMTYNVEARLVEFFLNNFFWNKKTVFVFSYVSASNPFFHGNRRFSGEPPQSKLARSGSRHDLFVWIEIHYKTLKHT